MLGDQPKVMGSRGRCETASEDEALRHRRTSTSPGFYSPKINLAVCTGETGVTDATTPAGCVIE